MYMCVYLFVYVFVVTVYFRHSVLTVNYETQILFGFNTK